MVKKIVLVVIWILTTIGFWKFDTWLISQPSDFLVTVGFLMFIAYAFLSVVTRCFWTLANF